MKKSLIPYIVAAALALPLAAQAQTFTSKPVGFTTETLAADSFSFIGINFVEATEASGTLTGVSGTTLTDTGADFSALPGGSLHIELADGTIAEIASVTDANNLVTATDISAQGAQDYVVRKSQTVGSLFGAANTAGFDPGAGSIGATTDVLWVPDGSGGFNKYYYNDGTFFLDSTPGWRLDGGGTTDQANAPILFTDAIIAQNVGTALDVVISGNVKTTSTKFDMQGGAFNFVSAVSPQGLTLGDMLGSSNEANLAPGAGSIGAATDVVWAPDGSGGFNKYYYNDGTFFLDSTPGWRLDGGGTSDASGAAMPSAVLIQRVGAATTIDLGVPASYSSL